MILRDIARQRLLNQRIASPTPNTPSDVVASLAGIQAQDYFGALWAIGMRLADATEAGIKQAIADRTIIRTWAMRGTLHFLAATDARWILELLMPRLIAGSLGRDRQLELTAAIFARIEKILVKALHGGRRLTRDAAYELLERARISTAGHRGIHILWRLAQERVICFGTHAAKQPTFVLLDEWLPSSKKLERDAALAELARRYFSSHGPATLRDFVWWSGLKVSDAKAGLEMVSSHLVQHTVGGTVYCDSRDASASRRVAPAVHLLPAFDEFLIGYRDRGASLDPRHAPKITPGGNGMLLPTVLNRGRVVGTWKRAFEKDALAIKASLFASPSKSEARAFASEIERYSRFLGVPIRRSDQEPGGIGLGTGWVWSQGSKRVKIVFAFSSPGAKMPLEMAEPGTGTQC
jgi:Winged helix DNA-binding domain